MKGFQETLEADILSKLFWNAEARAQQRWITDIFTRVHISYDFPENAVFGPYELKHTSIYDSIAFTALKSMDRRTAPYILRVEASAPNMRTDGPMWLRLVQSARSAEEQNLEAYVKNGQLFFRALRTIQKEEELLVWYGKDLAKFLFLNPLQIQSKVCTGPYTCANCNQCFETEFPFLPHQRFLSTQRQPNSHSTKPDFHNVARDMENIKTGSSSTRDYETRGSLKRKHTEPQRDPKKTKTETLRSPSHSEELFSFTDSATVTSAFSQVSENRRSAFSHPPHSVSFPQTTPLLGRAKTSITALWTRTTGRSPLQVQISLSPVLLSLVSWLSPLCLTAQIWCAKCNVSFRLISDLVQQYEVPPQEGAGRHRVRRLKCCICNEVFRQRHHHAGHLTSHT
uniref:PR/SET domain 8a n=1 Tax=Hucho hucho TaxID=62062 RepID=A0A4W5M9Q3_9TELE